MRVEMLEIDGAIGGGSVLRVGVGLAAALGKEIRIYNIRRARSQPGLQAQHLAGLLGVAELCDAEVEGAELGSQEIVFRPGKIGKDKLTIKIETAGSVGLVLQMLQLACLAASHPVEIEIDGGGTFGRWAPPLPYFELVNFAILRRFGYRAEVEVAREGFYPKGGARVTAIFHPPKVTGPLELGERGRLLHIRGVSLASHHLKRAEVAERQAATARQLLKYRVPIELDVRYADTRSPGSGIVLAAAF
ncbi:MAG: RNA 3'-terminal phosphate cyclase, partial [Candidatus Bipolaricaulia bacterium]